MALALGLPQVHLRKRLGDARCKMRNDGSTSFDGKLVIPNTVRNPSGVNRKCFATGMLRFAQHDNAISR